MDSARILDHDDYRDFLRDELAHRCQRNPRYSLRAFARDLGWNAARLSEVLNGKKGVSVEAAVQIAAVLGLSADDAEHLCDMVQARHARTAAARAVAMKRVLTRRRPAAKVLEDLVLEVIGEWQHLAILEIWNLEDFDPSAAWIAARLGLSEPVVLRALERLQKVGLLVEDEAGQLRRASSRLTTTTDIPSRTIRGLHAQMIAQALTALEEQPVDSRDYSFLNIAIDSARLPEIKELIARFRRDLGALAAKGDGDAIYSTTVQLFRLDKETGPGS